MQRQDDVIPLSWTLSKFWKPDIEAIEIPGILVNMTQLSVNLSHYPVSLDQQRI